MEPNDEQADNTSLDSAPSARVAGVLEGRLHYDSLTAEEQAVVRSTWDRAIDERTGSLDLQAEFTEEGRSWVELDDRGVVEGPSESA